jgi:RNA polymerase sigma-70 factor (ECF subfamily)
VRLQHLEGFTHSQIAEHLGIPVGTVKSRSNRAHRRLAGRLRYLREDAG